MGESCFPTLQKDMDFPVIAISHCSSKELTAAFYPCNTFYPCNIALISVRAMVSCWYADTWAETVFILTLKSKDLDYFPCCLQNHQLMNHSIWNKIASRTQI